MIARTFWIATLSLFATGCGDAFGSGEMTANTDGGHDVRRLDIDSGSFEQKDTGTSSVDANHTDAWVEDARSLDSGLPDVVHGDSAPGYACTLSMPQLGGRCDGICLGGCYVEKSQCDGDCYGECSGRCENDTGDCGHCDGECSGRCDTGEQIQCDDSCYVACLVSDESEMAEQCADSSSDAGDGSDI